MLEITSHRLRAPVYRILLKHETLQRVGRTSIRLISHSGELCNEISVNWSETLIAWSAFRYTAGSHKSEHNKKVARLPAQQSGDGVSGTQ